MDLGRLSRLNRDRREESGSTERVWGREWGRMEVRSMITERVALLECWQLPMIIFFPKYGLRKEAAREVDSSRITRNPFSSR